MKMCQLHTPVWVRDWKNKTNSASNIIMIDFEVHDCMLRVVEMNQWLYESIPCLGCMLHASSLFQISYFHPLHTAYNRPETFQLSLAVKEWYNLKWQIIWISCQTCEKAFLLGLRSFPSTCHFGFSALRNLQWLRAVYNVGDMSFNIN